MLPEEGKVLFLRLSAFGDVLHTLPAVNAFKKWRPGWVCHFLAEELSAPVLEGHPQLERVFCLRRKSWVRTLRQARLRRFCQEARQLFRELRQETYDLVLDFQANLRGAVVAFLAGGKRTVGFNRRNAKEGSWLLGRECIPPLRRDIPRVERNLALLRYLGWEGEDPGPVLPEFGRETEQAEEFLAQAGRPRFLFHPGVSRFGAFKAWTEEGFAELGRLLLDRIGGSVIISWGPGEKELAERIRQKSPREVLLGPQTRSLRDAAGLILACDLVIAPDTGILHLADALGRPLVGLFGPKDPRIYGPRYARRRIVRAGVACSPCEKRSCDDRSCMLQIKAEQVFSAVKELLAEVELGKN